MSSLNGVPYKTTSTIPTEPVSDGGRRPVVFEEMRHTFIEDKEIKKKISSLDRWLIFFVSLILWVVFVRWCGPTPCITVWPSPATFKSVHIDPHPTNKTDVVWFDIQEDAR